MTDTRSAMPSATRDFDTAAAPSFDALAQKIDTATNGSERWSASRQLADIGKNDPLQSVNAAVTLTAAALREKDAGLRYMTAGLLRDIGSAQAAAAQTAADGIAALNANEKDAYARRSMELALVDLARAQPQTIPAAANAIAKGIAHGSDALTRSLQAGQLTELIATQPAVAAGVIELVTNAFKGETEKLAAHHLSRTLVTMASDAALRAQVVGTLMDAMTTAPTALHPLEKTFAAAHALHVISADHPKQVAEAMADRLSGGTLGDNARRLCILGLGYAAEADKDCAAIAAPALLKAISTEAEPLYRRHIVSGVMKAVHNGFSSTEAGKALFAHQSAKTDTGMLENDRETRETINSTLRRLNHKTPATPMSIPAPK